MHKVEIGIFAYNEEENVSQMLLNISRQDIFNQPEYDVTVHLLANGCSDRTIEVAKQEIEKGHLKNIVVHSFVRGGKSRTWNEFVHNLASEESTILVFCDCDIQFVDSQTLFELCEKLNKNQYLKAYTSKPVKDLEFKTNLTFKEKLIKGSGGQLNNWKKSICGQLYALKYAVAKEIYLPIGLPVEDGFVRAMILTNNLSTKEDLSCIDGDEHIQHIYQSERKITDLIRHQVRIVIGSSINFIVFSELRKLESSIRQHNLFSNEQWLSQLIVRELPTQSYGWVPWSFLFKRLNYAFNPANTVSVKRIPLILLGFCFDLIVFVLAQAKMARGTGAGHW